MTAPNFKPNEIDNLYKNRFMSVFKHGSALGLTIPADIARSLGIKKRDMIKVILGEDDWIGLKKVAPQEIKAAQDLWN